MADYINKCVIEMNGQTLKCFKSVQEKAVSLHQEIELMNETGYGEKTKRHGFTVVWSRPHGGFPLNPLSIKNGVATFEYDDGSRVDFGGVYALEATPGTVDGNSGDELSVDYGADSRTPDIDG